MGRGDRKGRQNEKQEKLMGLWLSLLCHPSKADLETNRF